MNSLGRGKTNLDFDISQLYFPEKFPEILMFQFNSIFLDALNLTKLSISNINQVLPSLKEYQPKLYFHKLSQGFVRE